MKKLFIKRHWISEWNEKWIIQWGEYDQWLSSLWILETRNLADSIIRWLPLERVISSSLRRAKETWELIANTLNIDLTLSNILVEFNSWLLAWKDKEFIKYNYPEYYYIWMRRWDLDWIPWAETWNVLQARALLFLYDYIDRSNYSDLIVSHAWFIRCLVNTILDQNRETSVDINHATVHEFKDVWLKINHRQLFWWFSNRITQVITQNHGFIIRERKVNNEQYYRSINYIISRLNELSNITNKLYIFNLNWNKWVQICEYIEWCNIYGILDEDKEKSLFSLFNDLIHFFWLIQIDENIQLPSLDTKLLEFISRIKNEDLVNEWKKLLITLKFLNTNNLRIVDYDLHRWNLIFTKDWVRLIDLDSILISENEYQIACIVVSFLFEWYSNIDEILKNIRFDFSIEKVKFYIKVRAYIWVVFFQEIKENKVKIDKKTQELYNKYYGIFNLLS